MMLLRCPHCNRPYTVSEVSYGTVERDGDRWVIEATQRLDPCPCAPIDITIEAR